MNKIDYKQELKSLYQPSAKVVATLNVPPLRYWMVDGQGDPNTTPAYTEAIEALFSVSYTAKFLLKKELGIDYAVMPLESLWWADDMRAFAAQDRAQWRWTAMLMQPDIVPLEYLERARVLAAAKKALPTWSTLRLETLEEGRCAQIMHIGPFSEEAPTIAKLHEFITAQGSLRGKHHEIYLSDLRKTAPSKWKTVIRQPMA